MTGPLRCCRFARDNCPAYLQEDNFRALKEDDLISHLNIVSGTFMEALNQRQYSKVCIIPEKLGGTQSDWLSFTNLEQFAATVLDSPPQHDFQFFSL